MLFFGNHIPSGQDWLIDRMSMLIPNVDQNGICFGIAHMGMQAILAEDLDIFDQRLKLINDISKRKFDITIDKLNHKRLSINKQIKANKIPFRKLSDKEIRELDIPIFLEGVQLYQDDINFPELFPDHQEPKNQEDVLKIASLILSKKLKQRGGLAVIKTYSGIYTVNDLMIYFNELSRVIDKAAGFIRHPVALVLGSSNHAITVGYDPKNQLWSFIDANQLPSKRGLSIRELATIVNSAFSGNSLTTFSAKIYTNKMDEKIYKHCFDVLEQQKAWQYINTITPAKAKLTDSWDASWLHITVICDQVKLLKQLLKANANPNLPLSDEGETPLHNAVIYANSDCVTTLLAANANPNVTTKNDGCTPLYKAVENNLFDIAKSLLAASANPNICCTEDNSSPLFVAAEKGNMQMVKLLMRNGADASIPVKIDMACIQQFASNLHVEEGMKNLLIKKHVSSRQINNKRLFSITPAEIAEVMGHPEIANMLRANENGYRLHFNIFKRFTGIHAQKHENNLLLQNRRINSVKM